MTRNLYQFILWMHPPAFRHRFRDEMLSIFDEGGDWQAGFTLLLDGLISFVRQWLLRTNFWKIPLVICGAVIQVFAFGLPIKGHQSWTKNHQALTPYMQEVIIVMLALMCALFLMVISLSLWTVNLQRRRFEDYRTHLSVVAAAHRLMPRD